MSTKKYTVAVPNPANNKSPLEYGGIYFNKNKVVYPSTTKTGYSVAVNYASGSNDCLQGFYYKIADNEPILMHSPTSVFIPNKWDPVTIIPYTFADTAEWDYTAGPNISCDFTTAAGTKNISATKKRKKYTVTLSDGFWGSSALNYSFDYGTIIKPILAGAGVSHLSVDNHGTKSTLNLPEGNGGGFFNSEIWMSACGDIHVGTTDITNSSYTVTKTATLAMERIYFTWDGGTYSNVFRTSGSGFQNSNQNKNNSTSALNLSFYVPAELVGKYLYFSYSQSSENHYDYLHFYKIDDNKTEWDNAYGKTSGGLYYKIPATGNHTLLITYRKDGSGSSGSDTATVLSPGICNSMPSCPITLSSEIAYEWDDYLGTSVDNLYVYATNTSEYPCTIHLDTDIGMSYITTSDSGGPIEGSSLENHNYLDKNLTIPAHSTNHICLHFCTGETIQDYDLYLYMDDNAHVSGGSWNEAHS